MVKRSKFVYIIGSAIIGIVAIIFIFAGLALSGVIDAGRTKLIFKSASADKIYDGQVLTCEEWSIVDGTLKKGHTAKVVMLGEQTNAGVSENKFDITITDGNGADVSEDYKIVTEFGTLTVNPFPLTVQSGSAEKPYDGTPLTLDEYTIESFHELLEGHEVFVNITGSATLRDTKNTIADVRVLADGVDVTFNYDVTRIEGDLVIKGSPEGSGELSGGGAGSPSDEPLFYVTTDLPGDTVYLREASKGNYIKNDWTEPWVYEDAGKLNPLYYSGLALQQHGATPYSLRVRIAENNPNRELTYVLPYYVPVSQSKDKNDTKLSLAGLTEYTVTEFYSYDYFSEDAPVTLMDAQQAALEAEYAAYVQETYVALPEDTKAKMLEIAEKNDIDAGSETLVLDVARLVQGYLPYDTRIEKEYEGDYAVFFFEEAEEAYCQHYATAATAMYRALGIPSRWTKGYKVDLNGEDSPVSAQDYHAWVEIYADGFGWVPVEVTGGMGGQGGDDGQYGDDAEYQLIVRALNKSQNISAGDTLTADADGYYIEKDENDLLGQGYWIEAEVVGEQVGIGKSNATITKLKLFDPEGHDVTAQYAIKRKTGKLHIYEYSISISTESLEAQYDGKAHATAEDAYEIDPSSLELIEGNGHTVSVTVVGTQTDVGTSVNLAEVVILDGEGQDVTDYYKIQKNYGSLTVTLLHMSVTAGSAEKEYDGTALTCNQYVCEGLTIVKEVKEETGEEILRIQETGHTVSVTIVGEQTDVGTSANAVGEVLVFDENNTDVTKNYAVNCFDGTLTVKEATVE